MPLFLVFRARPAPQSFPRVFLFHKNLNMIFMTVILTMSWQLQDQCLLPRIGIQVLFLIMNKEVYCGGGSDSNFLSIECETRSSSRVIAKH